MEKMKVVAITSERKAEVCEIEKPKPKENEILVNLKACALCTFEQRVFTQTTKKALPYVGGHECAGIIDEIGSNIDEKEFIKGQKVAIRILQNCGYCHECRTGEENLCKNSYKKSAASAGKLLPNGLGEYIAVDVKQIYKLDNDISYEQAVLVEPLACCINSVERGNINLGDDVLIIGAGVMGIFHLVLSKLKGARVIISDPNEERLNMAKKFGCDIVINPNKESLTEKIMEITNKEGVNTVFNTTPFSEVIQDGIKSLGLMGTFIQYSSMHPDKPIEISPNFVHNSQIVITGTKSPSISSFEKSARLLSKKIVDLESLISESYTMEEATRAFERSLSPETFRVMIKW